MMTCSRKCQFCSPGCYSHRPASKRRLQPERPTGVTGCYSLNGSPNNKHSPASPKGFACRPAETAETSNNFLHVQPWGCEADGELILQMSLRKKTREKQCNTRPLVAGRRTHASRIFMFVGAGSHPSAERLRRTRALFTREQYPAAAACSLSSNV